MLRPVNRRGFLGNVTLALTSTLSTSVVNRGAESDLWKPAHSLYGNVGHFRMLETEFRGSTPCQALAAH